MFANRRDAISVTVDHANFALKPAHFFLPARYVPSPHKPAHLKDLRKSRLPLENIGSELVHELLRVGWDVPGIDVDISTYGSGENVIRTVRCISGKTEDGPFKLEFCEAQEQLGRYNIMTALSRATIPPGIEINFYGDNSGPSALVYVGKDWKADGDAFMERINVNARLNKQRKTYLRYSGRGDTHTMRADNDLGRDYDPMGDQPRSLDAGDIAKKVENFIRNTLMKRLSALPSAPGHDDVTFEGDANLRRICHVDPIPVPEGFPTLYVWADRNDGFRIREREYTDEDDLKADENYALSGNGWRLATKGRDLPKKARDGFDYASTDQDDRRGHAVYHPKYDAVPVIVTLKDLNEIYVADNAAFDRKAEEVRAELRAAGKERMTDSQLDDCMAAVGYTMLPASEYKGGFEKPVYLIGRQIGFDEARLVRGPVSLMKNDDTIRIQVADQESGLEFTLFDRSPFGKATEDAARREAQTFARVLSNNTYKVVELEAAAPAPAP